MEKNKSFAWSQGILIGLAALGSVLSFSLVIPIKPNIFELDTTNAVDTTPEKLASKPQTHKQIQYFKSAMLASWQKEAQAKGLLQTAPKRFSGKTINSANLSPKDKVIALTFDDGPWPEYTAQILDILEKNQVKGTFFVVGKMLKIYPDLGKRIVDEGHVIANHTWNHWYHYFSTQAAALEIDRTSDLIYKTTGVKTNLFRPPGGKLHNGLAAYAKSKNYTVIMWSADSIDYKRPSPSTLVNRVIGQSAPGGIVLMHDGGGNRSSTVAALPMMIEKYQQKGYRFVTVPELLQIKEEHKQVAAGKKQ